MSLRAQEAHASFQKIISCGNVLVKSFHSGDLIFHLQFTICPAKLDPSGVRSPGEKTVNQPCKFAWIARDDFRYHNISFQQNLSN